MVNIGQQIAARDPVYAGLWGTLLFKVRGIQELTLQEAPAILNKSKELRALIQREQWRVATDADYGSTMGSLLEKAKQFADNKCLDPVDYITDLLSSYTAEDIVACFLNVFQRVPIAMYASKLRPEMEWECPCLTDVPMIWLLHNLDWVSGAVRGGCAWLQSQQTKFAAAAPAPRPRPTRSPLNIYLAASS